jgi:uncharacterized protein with FMN-binding domain
LRKDIDMRKALTAVFSAVAIGIPVADATAATKNVVTVTKRVTGPQAQADRWGYIQVTLIVKKTTTTVGTKRTVKRKITGVTVPVYPNHTDRSVYINQQALPWLRQETLAAQLKGNIQLISGATNTSDAFVQSLQAALLAARKV